MIEQQKHIDAIRVENYGLSEWLKDVLEVASRGYTVDFDSNEGYPTSFGTMYTCLMLPVKKQEVVPEVTPVVAPEVGLGATPDAPPTEVTTESPKVDGRKKRV